jgi:hypothetical protein
MQFRKLLLIGASLGALIYIGTAGAAEAPQSSDSNPAAKPSPNAKPSAKSSADSSKEMTAQLQADSQVETVELRMFQARGQLRETSEGRITNYPWCRHMPLRSATDSRTKRGSPQFVLIRSVIGSC